MIRSAAIPKTRAAMALLLLAGATVAATTPSYGGSLENLERERAIVLEAMLAPDTSPTERQAAMAAAKPRLVDLERMVLRDDGLVGRNTPAVRRAFANYDLTFLVHAAMEKDTGLMDNWLDQVGITTGGLMSAKRGRRSNARSIDVSRR